MLQHPCKNTQLSLALYLPTLRRRISLCASDVLAGLSRRILLTSTLVCLARVPANTYQHPEVTSPSGTDGDTNPAISSGALVEIDGRPILQVYCSPRAHRGKHRPQMMQFLASDNFRPGSLLVGANDINSWSAFARQPQYSPLYVAVTEGDAQAIGRLRSQLGEEYAEIIRRTWSFTARNIRYLLCSVELSSVCVRRSACLQFYSRLSEFATSQEASSND